MIRLSRPTAPSSRRTSAGAVLLLASSLFAACSDEPIVGTGPVPARGALVLDGFIQPGMTLVADSGSSTVKVPFGPSTEFDAGGFTLERDTVLAVSSRGAGDLLYMLTVADGSVFRIQMPPRSNPGRARLLRGTGGRALIGIALRDSSSVHLLSMNSALSPTVTRIGNAGLCPTDVFQHGDATWVVDANADCRTNYAVRGDVRLIRVPNNGTLRDTLVLTGARGSAANAIVQGDVAYIAAGGVANFATTPYSLVATGSITKVDLVARRAVASRAMPAGSYGAGVKLGQDGFLYVSLYESLTTFANRTLKVRTDDLSFVTAPGAAAPWLPLVTTAGVDAGCGSATADALGRVHCIVNGAGSVTSLVVFDVLGREIRRVAAGQGGVDLALR